MIVVAGFLAVVVGPSGAVLMIPRSQNVPAGGTRYFLPATPEQLWPSILDSEDELPVCSTWNATQYAVCPSGGYDSIHSFLTDFNYQTSFEFTERDLQNAWASLSDYELAIRSTAAKVPPMRTSGEMRGLSPETYAFQPNALTAIMHQSLLDDWVMFASMYSKRGINSISQYKFAHRVVSAGPTTNPWVRVRCTDAQNLSRTEYDVRFPVSSGTPGSEQGGPTMPSLWMDEPEPIQMPDLNQEISSNVQMQWVELPTDQFGLVSGGVLLQFPWETTGNSRVVVGCSVSAVWFYDQIALSSTTIFQANSVGDTAWCLNWYLPKRKFANIDTSSHDAQKSYRPIAIRKSWFDSLNPTIPCDNCSNGNLSFTSLQKIFYDVGLFDAINTMRTGQIRFNSETGNCSYRPSRPDETDTELWNDYSCSQGSKRNFIELILATVFADGLSRHGSHRAFDIPLGNNNKSVFSWQLKTPPRGPNYGLSILRGSTTHSSSSSSSSSSSNAVLEPPSNSNYVKLDMTVSVVGYAWYASGITDYLATAVACLYMLIVLLHLIWLFCLGGNSCYGGGYRKPVTSSSWDTVTELLVLALRSPVPRKKLAGVGAGIRSLKTYEHIVKIRAVEDEEGEGKVGGEGCGGGSGEEKLVLILEGEASVHGNAVYKPVEVDKKYL